MARKPHADTRRAKYLDKRVLEPRPGKSQAEIAAEGRLHQPDHDGHSEEMGDVFVALSMAMGT